MRATRHLLANGSYRRRRRRRLAGTQTTGHHTPAYHPVRKPALCAYTEVPHRFRTRDELKAMDRSFMTPSPASTSPSPTGTPTIFYGVLHPRCARGIQSRPPPERGAVSFVPSLILSETRSASCTVLTGEARRRWQRNTSAAPTRAGTVITWTAHPPCIRCNERRRPGSYADVFARAPSSSRCPATGPQSTS